MFSLNFMFLCSLIEELCTKEENDKTSCNSNFGHECILLLKDMQPKEGGKNRVPYLSTESYKRIRKC